LLSLVEKNLCIPGGYFLCKFYLSHGFFLSLHFHLCPLFGSQLRVIEEIIGRSFNIIVIVIGSSTFVRITLLLTCSCKQAILIERAQNLKVNERADL
jgi:hypothetical protein